MAVNYMEDGTRTEPAPINAFLKSPSAILGHDETMVLPDVPATIFDTPSMLRKFAASSAGARSRPSARA